MFNNTECCLLPEVKIKPKYYNKLYYATESQKKKILMTLRRLCVFSSRTQKYFFIFLEPSKIVSFDKNCVLGFNS